MIWNIAWMNLIPIFSLLERPQFMFFDRVNQVVGMTKRVANAECNDRDEYGNPIFDWDDIRCDIDRKMTTPTAVAFMPEIYHRERQKYKWFKSIGVVHESSGSVTPSVRFWERYVRFMDKTKPLPDVPEFEVCRHLCPVTAEFDKQNQRPERYWRDMGFDQQMQIEEELDDECSTFDLLAEPPKEDITRPWERWTIDDALKDRMTFKEKCRRIMYQLCFGVR